MNDHATFDIFSGKYGDADATWLEAVEGLLLAIRRVHEMAIHDPGPYFIYDITHGIVRYRITPPSALDHFWSKMKIAREAWEHALRELTQAQESSYDLKEPNSGLAMRDARLRESRAMKNYAAAVRAYSDAVLRNRRQ